MEEATEPAKIDYKHPKNAELCLPPSFATRWDIAIAGSKKGGNAARVMAAALGVCWVHRGRLKAQYGGESVTAYGGEVIDELIERGIPWADIVVGGGRAFVLITGSIIPDDEVGDVEGKEHPADGPKPRS